MPDRGPGRRFDLTVTDDGACTSESIRSVPLRAIAEGFAQDIPVSEEVFGAFASLPGDLSFLARIDGTVVGGCGGRIIPEGRIAALYGTATLPAFRNARRTKRANRVSPA